MQARLCDIHHNSISVQWLVSAILGLHWQSRHQKHGACCSLSMCMLFFEQGESSRPTSLGLINKSGASTGWIWKMWEWIMDRTRHVSCLFCQLQRRCGLHRHFLVQVMVRDSVWASSQLHFHVYRLLLSKSAQNWIKLSSQRCSGWMNFLWSKLVRLSGDAGFCSPPTSLNRNADWECFFEHCSSLPLRYGCWFTHSNQQHARGRPIRRNPCRGRLVMSLVLSRYLIFRIYPIYYLFLTIAGFWGN